MSDGDGGGGGDMLCLLLFLKYWSARGASHHPAFMATAGLLITHF